MQSQFRGHIPLSQEACQEIWSDCLFVFDTNVLLGFYRYSKGTREQFFKILEKIKSLCWLPHQVIKEFLDNRLIVIGKQQDACKSAIKSINDLADKFNSKYEHPFLSDKLLKDINIVFESARSELSDNEKLHSDMYANDRILYELTAIFDSNIGDPYNSEKIKELEAIGQDRYSKNIPPGYNDKSKDGGGDLLKKYGDLILWNQILDKAKDSNKNIVFVTDDRKDDWWLEFRGKTIGARPELVQEFYYYAGRNYLQYRPDRFIEYASIHFDEQVSQATLSEVRDSNYIEINTDDLFPLHPVLKTNDLGKLSDIVETVELEIKAIENAIALCINNKLECSQTEQNIINFDAKLRRLNDELAWKQFQLATVKKIVSSID